MLRISSISVAIIGAISLFAGIQPAAAMGSVIGSLHASSMAAVRASIAMREGALTAPPTGHILMCMKHPEECRVTPAPSGRAGNDGMVHKVAVERAAEDTPTEDYAPVPLTREAWSQLKSVNARVNAAIRPVEDIDATGKRDHWSVSGRRGDCEDFAIRKRQALIRMGWPSHATLIALATHPVYGLHAVLVARTSKGDYVLDNLRKSVVPWKEANYHWIKRQSRSNPRKWVRVTTGTARVAARGAIDPSLMAGIRGTSTNEFRKMLSAVVKQRGGHVPAVKKTRGHEKAVRRPAKTSRVEMAESRPTTTRYTQAAAPAGRVGVSATRHALDRGVATVWTGGSVHIDARPQAKRNPRTKPRVQGGARTRKGWYSY